MKIIKRNVLNGIIILLCIFASEIAYSGAIRGGSGPKVDASPHFETHTKIDIESTPTYRSHTSMDSSSYGTTQGITQGKTLGSSSVTIARPSTSVSSIRNTKTNIDINSDINITSTRAARREVMRHKDIPTSQQPVSQALNASGRSYEYKTPKPGGGTQTMSVQQQTLDRSHSGQAHWEAGSVKTNPVSGQFRKNQYGRPKLTNDKSKVNYNE